MKPGETKMKNKPYLLFDAGGTLVFPDQGFLVEIAREYDIELNDTQLFNGYYSLIHNLDRQANKYGYFSRNPWPNGYTYSLLRTIGVQEPKARIIGEIANRRHEVKSLWTFTFSWVYEILTYLKDEGYRMSVISNSDGRIGQVLKDLALDRYFEEVFASGTLGVEKTDAAIYEIALDRLKISPIDALYIGDVFTVDIKGANLVGMGAIHIDPLGLYASCPGVHLENITCLGRWLPIYENYAEFLLTKFFPYKMDSNLLLLEKYRIYSLSTGNTFVAYSTPSSSLGR